MCVYLQVIALSLSPKFGFYSGLVGSLEHVFVLWAMRVFNNEVVELKPIFSVLVLSVSFWVMGKTKRSDIYSNARAQVYLCTKCWYTYKEWLGALVNEKLLTPIDQMEL